MRPQLWYLPWAVSGSCGPLKKFKSRQGLGVVQTVRDDIAANWTCAYWPDATYLTAGHWPLEPGRAGGELGHREWHLWIASHGGWPSRQTQRGGRVDCGGCH